MSERNIRVTMEPSSSPSLPFYDRHFAPLLALAGVLIAAFFAMSDNVLNLFINQPPEVQINLKPSDSQVGQGEGLFAWTILSDKDGAEKDTQYKWELIGLKAELPSGVGEEFSRVNLPTDKADKYTILLTITDKSGKGKSFKAYKEYVVREAKPENITPTSHGKGASSKNTAPVSTERIVLSKDKTIDWSELRAKEIVTNGHKLTINASDITSPLKIVSYQRSAASGMDGEAGNPGTNGSFMQAGTNGSRGKDGFAGAAGERASEIRINVKGLLDSKLIIENSGQTGGSGGAGGRGGPGGSGGQGHPAKSGIIDCNSGPGRGAQGGDGGNGGTGGSGGSGGDGGLVKISVKELGANGAIKVVSNGGIGGFPGTGGDGGIPGAGGPEGNTGGLCSSAGRQGPTGIAGQSGASGLQGGNGSDGKIVLSLGSKVIESVKYLEYPE